MSKAHIQDLVGIPFKKNGRDKLGINCYYLAQKVFERYGVSIPDYVNACSSAADSNLQSNVINSRIDSKRKDWVKIAEPVEPCLVVLRSDEDNPDMCSHIGVYVGEGKFIHIMKKVNSIIQRVDTPLWSSRIEGYYIYNG
jgi:cell wall-associated NlpC family hydrolase